MRKLGLIFIVLLIYNAMVSVVFADAQVPSKTIHLVYDDSGSMIRLGHSYVDTWCQAKYAMEVVAAMLDERDVLNVYYMSDYDRGVSAEPRLRLQGSRNAAIVSANVALIHQTITPFGNTPFNAVRKASSDLKHAQTDERWLLVLTDGEFEDGKMSQKEVEAYYADVVRDGRIKIIMLAMGPEAAIINPDESGGIYFEHATSTTDILPKLTRLSNRIFQRNVLDVVQNNQKHQISFSVPMRQLIVFAQGKDVKIGDSIQSGDKAFQPSSNVHVTYSTQSSTQNPPDAVVATNLNGYIATFDGAFEPGSYLLNVSNSESIDVYYKPNVNINAYLFDLDGKEVTEDVDIVNGQYKLDFGFVDATTGEKVIDTSLLGNIEFDSRIVNTFEDGSKDEIEAASGDMVSLKEGKIDIDVRAKFLEYNVVHTKLTFQVFFRNELVYQIDEMPEYRLAKDGLKAEQALRVTVQMKDGDKLIALTPEQWEEMGLPSVATKAKMGGFEVKKGDEIGEFLLLPKLGEVDPMVAETGDIPFVISGGFKRAKSSAAGRMTSSIVIYDDISRLERIADWLNRHWKSVLFGAIAAFILFGYIPGVKKYFSKRLKKKIVIKGEPNRGTRGKSQSLNGRFNRHFSTYLPYKASRGRLRTSISGVPAIEFKSAGGGQMYIVNKDKFTDSKKYDFGVEIMKTRKTLITVSRELKIMTPEYQYKFSLNQGK